MKIRHWIRRLRLLIRADRLARALLYALLPWLTVRHRRQLDAILEEYAGRPIVIGRPFIRWDIPLFQRPQHLARFLGANGVLYFFPTSQPSRDLSVHGFRRIA
ncbi:MAG: hypothetical protein IIA30_05610, partial [Myxococcales bacterium]|nr:hypothetical protein [Myxococcales bacterium]